MNYLGSLRPVYDESSLQLADAFYGFLDKGVSAGEALRRAKQRAFGAGDPIWSDVVMFGCPRNRLRAPR